jgi:hypothetical protein
VSLVAPCSLMMEPEVEEGYRNPLPLPPVLVRNDVGGVELIGLTLNAARGGPELVWRLGEGVAWRASPPPLAFELMNGEGAREREVRREE